MIFLITRCLSESRSDWLSRLTRADVWVEAEAVPNRCCKGSGINTNTWPEAPRDNMLHSTISKLCGSQTDRAKPGCCHFAESERPIKDYPPLYFLLLLITFYHSPSKPPEGIFQSEPDILRQEQLCESTFSSSCMKI